MNGTKSLIVALVICCLLVLPAYGEDPPSPQEFERMSLREDHQQRELTELKKAVARLLKRIELLEKQFAQKEPRIQFETAREFEAAKNFKVTERPGINIPSPRGPSPISLDFAFPMQTKQTKKTGFFPSGVEKAMMIDAFEHGRRWGRRARARPGMETMREVEVKPNEAPRVTPIKTPNAADETP
ncbi:MAG: hypothetical protein V3R99_08085 [Thermoguttaceae bacterium]